MVCRYEKMLQWRKVISQVSEATLVMAYMAKRDALNGIQRKVFANKPVVTHNNVQLKMILNRGFSENHFHLMGSAPYFQLSWIQLMNRLSDRRTEKYLQEIEDRRRNVNVHYSRRYQEGFLKTRVRQAFLIRLYLFSRLAKMPLKLDDYYVETYRLDFHFDKLEIEAKYSFDGGILSKVWKESHSKKRILELLKMVWMKDDLYLKFMNQYPEFYDFLRNAVSEALSPPSDSWAGRKWTVVELTEYFLNHQSYISLETCRNFIDDCIYNSLQTESTLKYLRYLLVNEFSLEMRMPDFQGIVNTIKGIYKFLVRDYAIILSDYEWYDQRGGYVDLWGERVFLYQCFRRIIQEGYLFSAYESNLFYAYLVIKENIRSELVQVNEYVGFENFKIHQDRKEYFSDGIDFEKSMARMAVRDTLQSQRILHLEARVSPGLSVEENLKKIEFYDGAIGKEICDRFYYVFHFIKSEDKETEFMECRHFKKRKDILKRAYALKKFRTRYPLTAVRVLGIDAASQEIGCRPEVFGSVFRGLKSHMCAYIDGDMKQKKLLPRLRASYHVGEIFWIFWMDYGQLMKPFYSLD